MVQHKIHLDKDVSQILYTSKAGDDKNFPPLDMNADTTINNGGWSEFRDLLLDESDVQANNPANSNHKTRYAIYPKICLLGRYSRSVLVWKCWCFIHHFIKKRYGGVCQCWREESWRSLIVFNQVKSDSRLLKTPQPNINHQDNDVIYYDAIVDENDKGVIVAIKDDAGSGITVKHQVSIVQFNTRLALAKQYSANTRLWWFSHIVIAANIWRHAKMRNVNTHYNNPTLTTNGRRISLGSWLHNWWNKSRFHWCNIPRCFFPKTDESSVNALGFPSVPKSARFGRTRWLC